MADDTMEGTEKKTKTGQWREDAQVRSQRWRRGNEDEERWSCSWQAIKQVWASKWNERAFLCCQKAKLNHDNICMAVLIQEVICGDYAFVIHTKNPISRDATEIYAEIVKGLGESLVGAYPGRAMTFTAKKTNLKPPMVTCFPSKLTRSYSKKSIIFRSDSNAEDFEGFSGAGIFYRDRKNHRGPLRLPSRH